MSESKTPQKPATVKVRLVRKSRGRTLGQVVETTPAKAARLVADRHAVKAD